MADIEYLTRLTRDLVDQGKLIEAGWVGLRLTAIPDNAHPTQLKEMRMAFFAGAQHVFGSMMSFLEEGQEPTATDISRLTMLDQELNEFLTGFKADHGL